MRRAVALGFAAALAGLAAWIVLLPDDWENWFGFSRYDYFTAGTNYAFTSGPGPMLLTALLGSSVLAGLWHHLNCHEDGCWRLGRHKVKGTPWCNAHHGSARTEATLDDVVARLDTLIQLVRGGDRM